MRNGQYTNFVLTMTVTVLLFMVWERYENTQVVRAANPQNVRIAGTGGVFPMSSGQKSQTTTPATRQVIDRFNEAFNRHDAGALAALLTDDTVFEDTSPAPDGKRIEGKAEVVAFWRVWFAWNADAAFEVEDVIVSGDRAVVLWVYRKSRNGQPWHLRGVDVFTVRDGKVAAKLAYVKG
jgi:ketosteroid isomerase-like protein